MLSNSKTQTFQAISSKNSMIKNYINSCCALARPNQRSIWFGLPFSLFLSFGQTKERKMLPNDGMIMFTLPITVEKK